MEQRPLISIIVPVYKVEAYLNRCVDSLLAQTYDKLELILVDDGSPDRCGEICDEYAEKDCRIRVIHKENGGLSDARNAGIEAARGEYLGFCDSDDWMEPDAYGAMLEFALREEVKLVCAGRYDVSGRTGERRLGLCPPETQVVSGEETVRRIFLWEHMDSAAWDKIYHRSLFETIRYPVGRVHEDVPVTYRIALLAQRVGMLSKPIYNYYHRPGSITYAAFNGRIFQLAEHAAQVYEAIAIPSLEEPARHLLVRCHGYALLQAQLATREDRRRFSEQCRACRRVLGKQLLFLLRYPAFEAKWKRDFTLLALGLYRPAQKLYRLIKKEAQ